MAGNMRVQSFGWRIGGSALALAAAVATAAPVSAADCWDLNGMAKNFSSLYPTGGEAARFDGERGRKVMQGLATDTVGDEIVFLYSGHGPVTGARGRYMYMVLDPGECILDSDWIDGDAFDRAIAAE